MAAAAMTSMTLAGLRGTGRMIAQPAPPTLEKKNYTYSEWTKGRFSEAVTVTGPGKTIYLAGVGAEDENGTAGTILHNGDFIGDGRQMRKQFRKLDATLTMPAELVG